MNIALWVIQILVGLLFILSGGAKATQPIPALANRMTFVNSFSEPFVRFIGVAEFLGGIGLIIPAATGILPWLTIVAAGGLAIIMTGAVVYHVQHRETNEIIPTGVLLLLAVLVLVGRLAVSPF